MANLDKDYYLDEQGLQTLINELETNLVALEYSSSATYAVGDYCVHDNKMYRCTTAISTAENWNSAHWSLVIISDELKSKKSGTVTSVTIKGTSPIVSSSESAITTSGTRTISHANSGVTAGTYKSVTVNATGHVTDGTNPTTLSGYGITDAKIESNTVTLGSNSIQIPTITDTYSGTSSDGMSGKAVKSAIDALDGGTIGTPSASKTLTALSQTNGNISATFGDISIANTQVSGLGTASTKDVPASGNASTTQVVLGSDTRLSNARTPTSHTHGNIQNGGTLQTNDITIANGDKLVVTDSSDSAKVARTSISFDASTTTKALTPKGTWESFTNNTGTVTSVTIKGTSPISSSNSTAITGSGETTISLGTVPIANGGTGATTALGATDNLGALNWGKTGTTLTSGTNVDTDLESGKTYYSASSSASQALAGTVPTTESGFKIVQLANYSSNYTIQIATALNGNVWIREKYKDGSTYPWGDWRIFYTSYTLTSQAASSGGTAVSLVTTGEKYTWNNKVDRAGDTMTGNLTIKVTSTYDDNSPSRIGFQAVDSTNSTTSTATISAYNGGSNGANLVIQPGGNMFLGSGEAAINHYNSAYTHSATEVMFITSDNQIHIQSNGQTIANRVGVQIDSSGNLVPDRADVATNNIGGIGTSTYKWANGYFTNINGVEVGDSPKFTDTWRTISINSTNISDKSLKISAGTNVSFTETTTSSAYNITINATDTDTKVTQTVLGSSATHWRKLVLGYSDSTSAGATASDVTDITYVDNALEYKPDTETLSTTNLTIAPPANNATFPTGGIKVHDLRGYDSTVPTTQGVNFFFSNNTMPTATWWSGIYIKGYSGAYAPWELVGYAGNGDGRNNALFVRTSNGTTAWGNWRKIYDASNPPAFSEISSTPTTLSGYGITDAKIASGVITLGSNTITPLTASSTLDATKLSGTIPSGCYTDTKNTAGSTDISTKIFLIGASSQTDNPQTYSDDQVYATSGTLYCNQLRASTGVYSNTGSNTTSGGLSLWGTSAPEVYGVSMRTTGTASGELGKHGYVTGTHAVYFCMNTTTSSLNRGWVFRHYRLSENVASINTDGNAVFNGSVTVGGNAANTSGCRLTYNSTTKSCDFVFA